MDKELNIMEKLVATGRKAIESFSLEKGKEYILEIEIGARNMNSQQVAEKLSGIINYIIDKINLVIKMSGLEPIAYTYTETKLNVLRLYFKRL